ncbi:MAG: hypothetical protein ACLSUM_12380 [Dysosmobacter welbionis]
MQNLERMRELIQTINEADEAYYKYDAPILAALDYDRLYDELGYGREQDHPVLVAHPAGIRRGAGEPHRRAPHPADAVR